MIQIEIYTQDKLLRAGTNQVGSQESVGDKGAGQLSILDVVLDLETHVVAGQIFLKLSWLRRIEFDLESQFKSYTSGKSWLAIPLNIQRNSFYNNFSQDISMIPDLSTLNQSYETCT